MRVTRRRKTAFKGGRCFADRRLRLFVLLSTAHAQEKERETSGRARGSPWEGREVAARTWGGGGGSGRLAGGAVQLGDVQNDGGEHGGFLGRGPSSASSGVASCARDREIREARECGGAGVECARRSAEGGGETRCERGRLLPRPRTPRCAQHGREQQQHW